MSADHADLIARLRDLRFVDSLVRKEAADAIESLVRERERVIRALRELVTARDGLKQGRQESADHYLAAWRQARAALKDAP